MGKPPPWVSTAAAVAVAAGVGSAGTDVTSRWYRRLDKPAWQPPGGVFGIAWTVLYALIAAAGGRALAVPSEPDRRRGYRQAYAVNLVLNAGWSWSFFRAKRPVLAVVEVAALEVSTLDLLRRTRTLDRPAGWALLPYAAWVSFATALTASLAWRNRGTS